MISLEQVKLLESKVSKALDFVKLLSDENKVLRTKLDGYKRRIDELEVLIKAFRDDQGRIETSILSALDRLNQFEDAIERGLSQREDEDAESADNSAQTESSVNEGPSSENNDAEQEETEENVSESPDLHEELPQENGEPEENTLDEEDGTGGHVAELDIF